MIPERFNKHPALVDAYNEGFNHGHGIACHNVPSIGDRIDRSVDWCGCGDIVDAENIREYHELLCFAAEENSRCYSPFEFTAHAINQADNPESEEAAALAQTAAEAVGFYVIVDDDDDNEDGPFGYANSGGQYGPTYVKETYSEGCIFETEGEAWLAACEKAGLYVPDSNDLWEAFEEGTTDSIRDDLAGYTDEDYGIEDDE